MPALWTYSAMTAGAIQGAITTDGLRYGAVMCRAQRARTGGRFCDAEVLGLITTGYVNHRAPAAAAVSAGNRNARMVRRIDGLSYYPAIGFRYYVTARRARHSDAQPTF